MSEQMERKNVLTLTSFNRMSQGTITVFFSLILLIILSFVLTIVEGARINSAQLLTQRALLVSMDSILAEYYRPLWEEYHIFGLDLGYGTSEESIDEVSSRMERYLKDQISPTHSTINNEVLGGIDLYELSIEQIEIESPVMLTDYDGELFLYQSSEYMKYKVLGNGVEQILDQMSLMETPKKVSIIYEEKVKVEEELSKIDQGLLKLMELFDGIKTSKKGITKSKEGGLSVKNEFIKKICTTTVTQSNVGINHPVVFHVLKDQYYNPLHDINVIEQKIRLIQSKQNENYNLRSDMQYNNLAIMEHTREIEEINKKQSLIKKDKERIKALDRLIQELNDENNNISKEITDNGIRIREYKSQGMEVSNFICDVINGIFPLYHDAYVVLDHIVSQQGISKIEVQGLEQLMEEEKDGLEEDIYQSLLDELNQMKKYVGDGTNGYDFDRMKEILIENEKSMRSLQTSMGNLIELLERGEIDKSIHQITVGKEAIKDNGIGELAIDYSSLVLETQQKSSLDSMMDLIENGLYQLVVDTNEVSKKTLSNELMPSNAYESAVSPMEFSIEDFFTGVMKNQSGTQLSELFQGINQQENSGLDGLGQVANQLGRTILYQEYYKEHFYDYESSREDEKLQKPSVLDYEREYLLFGNITDEDNLRSMINHILLSRVMFNFISLLKDKGSCTEANLMAAAMVGFTSLPILVNITKIMILLVWSFGEALVDTAALLQGLKVPIIKHQLMMSLPDILLISPSYIKEKVNGIAKTSQSKKLSMGYGDYLYLLLLSRNPLKVSYRGMDLVQENLRIRYDDNFRINLCLYGFTGNVTYRMPTKFISLLNYNNLIQEYKGYTIKKQSQYSY